MGHRRVNHLPEQVSEGKRGVCDAWSFLHWYSLQDIRDDKCCSGEVRPENDSLGSNV